MQSDVQCPICEAPSVTDLTTYTTEEAASHFCPPHRDEERYDRLVNAIANLWPESTCTVYRCDHCGFGFGTPYRGGDDRFYSILHEQMGYPVWRWDYDVALEKIGSSRGKRVLDIGAGSGNFLSSLDSGSERFAVESSSTTIQALAERGISAVPTLEALGPQYEGSFDVITMFQVLEHIAPPTDVLQACSRLLVPGGLLIITVPDADAMFTQERVLGAPDMPPNHINKWTRQSLSYAVGKEGIKPESYCEEPSALHLIRDRLHLKLMRDSQNPRTLAGLVYRIRNRSVRAALLAAIAPIALVRLLPHVSYLMSGGSFALTARRQSP